MKKQKVGASIVVIKGESGWLMIKRSNHLDSYPGRWAFPGGGIEEGEEPILAGCREIWEEVGIALNPIDLFEIGYQNHESKKIFFWLCFVNKPAIKINDESEDWGWFKLSEVLNLNTIPIPEYVIKIMKDVESKANATQNTTNVQLIFGEDWMD